LLLVHRDKVTGIDRLFVSVGVSFERLSKCEGLSQQKA